MVLWTFITNIRKKRRNKIQSFRRIILIKIKGRRIKKKKGRRKKIKGGRKKKKGGRKIKKGRRKKKKKIRIIKTKKPRK